MEAIHDLVGSVLDHIAPAFAEERLPPAVLAELRDAWLAKMDAAGMLRADPSPFPTRSSLATHDRAVLKRVGAAKRPPRRVARPDGGWFGPERQGAPDCDFGRPQPARAPPPAHVTREGDFAFEVVGASEGPRLMAPSATRGETPAPTLAAALDGACEAARPERDDDGSDAIPCEEFD
ncbi:hypothetical protein KFE25_001255 [Diacronema lutheri]|uniref:Uncharacterized protein n=1 Tax=Diacronema lutheri TaxID=2081491 RepID=A0A8J5XDE0_DIALT|nr:hypothetical protein KFE25_001255 [Diacronema lutheri]